MIFGPGELKYGKKVQRYKALKNTPVKYIAERVK
jgi:hypothetical protein